MFPLLPRALTDGDEKLVQLIERLDKCIGCSSAGSVERFLRRIALAQDHQRLAALLVEGHRGDRLPLEPHRLFPQSGVAATNETRYDLNRFQPKLRRQAEHGLSPPTGLSLVACRGFTQRAAVVVALLGAVACVEWRPEAVPAPNSRAADRLPSEAWIVTGDGRELLLLDPYVRNDSLIGGVPGVRGGAPEVVGVALKEIRSLEARRPSAGRSAMLAAGIVCGMIAVLNLLYGEGS